jgi:hypothetical protein
MSDTSLIKNHAAFIWSVADLLRGDYKQSEYGKVIMPDTRFAWYFRCRSGVSPCAGLKYASWMVMP